ncbi:glycosyltransferase [Vreelandella sp. EE27]
MTQTSQPSQQSEQKEVTDVEEHSRDTISASPEPSEAALDKDFYQKTYPDLASLSEESLVQHWLDHGYSEGRFGSEAYKAEFERGLKLDAAFYREHYVDLAELDEAQLYNHWYTQGYLEGRYANAAHRAEHENGLVLDVDYYRHAYADIAKMSDKEALRHWYLHGYTEGRSGSRAHEAELHSGIELDIEYYKQAYSDMALLEDVAVSRHWYRHGYLEGRSASKAHAELITKELDFDPDFYRATYEDAASLSDLRARQHWFSQGFLEGRFVSNAHYEMENEAQEEELRVYEVDLPLYLHLYPDLESHGIETLDQAEDHFQRHGKAEERSANLEQWAAKQELPVSALPEAMTLVGIQNQSHERGVELTYAEILNAIAGKAASAAMLCETEEETYQTYCLLAESRLGNNQNDAAHKLLLSALAFKKGSMAFRLLGDSYLQQSHYSTALAYFRQASSYSDDSQRLYVGELTCLAALQRDEEAISLLQQVIQHEPRLNEKLDDLAESYWNTLQSQLFASVDADERQRLIQLNNTYAYKLYNAYFSTYSDSHLELEEVENALASLPALGDIDQQKILIVGDFHVPQCIRYRINQKVEQLEAASKTVTTLDWLDLETHHNTVALHDIVIFYRVPAVPRVIKAIAQVNAVGKLSLYEIDDLLFEPIYPPPIESYGGFVSLETYRGLAHGMALFNSAARLCRHGIASTEPLCTRLADLVQSKKCLLHRNGLDHLNQIKQSVRNNKSTIDIFYGSGTQAHNSDFTDLALPALEQILTEQPNTRLVVVGYLSLPDLFCKRFASQLVQIPPMENVQGYWSLLEQADINLAVLHSDEINDCKSELKWFEAACFGVPSIVSDTANYRDVIQHGEDAYIARNSDEWYSALNMLISSTDHRHQVGQAAMRRVQKEYTLEALGGQLAEQLSKLVSGQSEGVGSQVKPKRKKVALVNVFFPPQAVGGATRVVADNFTALQKHHADDIELCVFTGDAECRTPHRLSVHHYQGVRVYRATTLWRVDMDWHPWDDEMYWLFSEFLALEKPDVVHFHCVQRLTASVVAAARDAGVPYIVTAHDAWWISDFQFLVDHNDTVYPEGHPDPFAPITLPPSISLTASVARRRDLKDLLQGAQKVLTVSHAFADIYRKNGVPHIKVIPNGISDDMPWAPKDTSHTSRVVCAHVGGMAAHKGYYLLKEAVMEAQPENLEFIVVDHAKEEGYLAKRYWGKVPVTFIGRVGQQRIVDLYRQMDVLFAPSLWPESFGLVTREAAACGCWVIASNLGGIGEDIIEGKTGHVITPDYSDLLKVIKNVDSNHFLYKECVENENGARALEQTTLLVSEYND